MPVAQFPRFKSQRQPNLHATIRKLGARRHDSNHCFWLGIQRDALANNVGVSAKTLLPEFMAKKRDMMLAKDLLFGQEATTQDRSYSEQPEHIGRDAPASNY